MIDVELVDDDREPRDYDPILKEVSASRNYQMSNYEISRIKSYSFATIS